MTEPDLLDRTIRRPGGSYALLHRPGAHPEPTLEVLAGSPVRARRLAELPLGEPTGRAAELLVLLPYRQLRERGFEVRDDGTPLLALAVAESAELPLAGALRRLPSVAVRTSGDTFEPDDARYAETVRSVIDDVIGRGDGANFVIRRSFVATIDGYRPEHALSFFRRLVEQERGAYWVFLVHTPGRTLVGATPERHLSLQDGLATMNPISGTYRYPPTGPDLAGFLQFLADEKETDELYMVVDEELKMMARICSSGGRVIGPQVRQMARLAHTEYHIVGHSDRDPREVLRETMFAPTVTGSPIESACRVISRYEPSGRGYYAGVIGLIGSDRAGRRQLDSAILIRTADIDAVGRIEIGVGATLVRHSDPQSEVAETRAKAAGLLAALHARGASLADDADVTAALGRRNDGISDFWLADHAVRARPDPVLAGRRVLIVDAEDTFTAMLHHQLDSLGLRVTGRGWADLPADPGSWDLDAWDLVVLGPGPGDPNDRDDPKIAALDRATATLLRRRRRFVAICLGHQVLALRLGLPVRRKAKPNQGVQRGIVLAGRRRQVGFYNTFAAVAGQDRIAVAGVGEVWLTRDPASGEVHAMSGPHFASMQFHPESILTRQGLDIISDIFREVVSHEGQHQLVGS
ncbi:MAG TPA: chorismate-binding protein [Jatrophihabitans sp.]|nr:chorismate-binding protein [Jatrophihabitans sp.]